MTDRFVELNLSYKHIKVGNEQQKKSSNAITVHKLKA